MKDFFLDILEYNHTYNLQLLEVFENHSDKIPEKAQLLLSHLINAQKIWNSRILSSELISGIWETIPLSQLKEIEFENYKTSKKSLKPKI